MTMVTQRASNPFDPAQRQSETDNRKEKNVENVDRSQAPDFLKPLHPLTFVRLIRV